MPPPARYTPAAIRPTDEQLAIQTSRAPTLLVRANAGAAKTTTLALRIAEALARGAAPQRVLALTYTEPACEALRRALDKIGVARPAAARLRILTFDAFAAEVLLGIEREAPPLLRRPEDAAPWVERAAAERGVAADRGFVERLLALALRLKGTLQLELARWEGRRIDAELAEEWNVEPAMLRVLLAYERLRYPPLDGCDRPEFRTAFDATYDLARTLADPEPSTRLDELAAWPRDLQLVVVDEMHDLNRAMYAILRALLDGQPCAFCGVGDDDQVIHAAAGAERRYMAADTDFGRGRSATLLPLTASYRFDAALAGWAGKLARKPYASAAAQATRLRCLGYDDAADGARRVVQVAAEWAAAGRKGSELVVVLRHPYQSVLIENALLQADMPYTTAGFDSYVMQPEVLLIRALLAIVTNDYGGLQAAATRREMVRALVFFCEVRLGHDLSAAETPQERLARAVQVVGEDASLLRPFVEHQVLREGNPAAARRIRAALDAAAGGFEALLEALRLDELAERRFVERQRRSDARAYLDGLRVAAREHATLDGFFRTLNLSELRTARGRLGASASPHKDAVRAAALKRASLLLASVEAVKGLEFAHVVLPGLADGEFPARLAPERPDEANRYYVAITRARDALTLLADRRRPSRFVAEIGAKLE